MPSPVKAAPDLDHCEVIHRAFNAALAAFQAEMGGARRDGKNPHFRTTYATLASVIEAVKGATKFGLSHTQTTTIHEGQLLLVTTLRHADGYEVRSELPLTLSGDWQKFGSGLSYARRYALMGIYGISSSDDDDDAEIASNADSRRPAPKAPPTAPAKSKKPAASPLAARVEAITQKLAELNPQSPETVKALVEEYRTTFAIPKADTVVASLQDEERVAWFESNLGLSPAPVPDAPAA